MRILGDLNFLDRGESRKDAAEPEQLEQPLMPDLSDSPPPDLSDEEDEGGADHYAAAVRAYLRGDFDAALEELHAAKAAGEDLAEVCTAVAQIYLERREFEQAVDSYQELLALDPNNPAAQFNYGLALEALERYQEARVAFQAAVNQAPDLTEAWLGLGGACLKCGDAAGAREAYETYLRSDEDSFAATFGVSAAYQLEENHQKAIEHYVIALDKQPDSVEVLTNLAGVYVKTAAFEDAENCFRKLLELSSDNAKAHEGLAYVLYRQDKLEESQEHYERLTELEPESYEGWYNLGLVSQKRGDFEAGRSTL